MTYQPTLYGLPQSRGWKLAALFALVVGIAASADAALPRRPLLGRPLLAQPQEAEIEAFAGEPFGVGRIAIKLPPTQKDFSPGSGDFQVVEKNGRVLYPTFDAATNVRALLRDLLDRPPQISYYFLFKGTDPLDLTIYSPAPQKLTIQPQNDNAGHARLLAVWWREFTQQKLMRSGNNDDMPPDVENYLSAMLSRRLGLTYDREFAQLTGQKEVDQTLGMLLGTESIRAAMQKNTMLRTNAGNEAADQPLPTPVTPPKLDLPDTSDVAIEPMAKHVPHECFYVRFGSFENFQWLRSTLDEWGGDLRNLMAVRGVDNANSARMEKQLAMKENALSKIFGPQVVADVAVIGTDTFVREGAGVGILFQAKNNFLFSSSVAQQRSEALKLPGAKEESLKFGDHQVSFIHTPDNSVRTFYAVDGDFHLVTNSHYIVQRFYEAGQGNDALGDSKEFHYARSVLPVSNLHTAFIYLSDEFFRNIVGPKYRVEMTRRMQAITDLELIQLAKLAAQAEGKPNDSIDHLIQGSFLPSGFGQAPDGSHPEAEKDRYVDSLRGARGTFLPVGDVDVEKVTRSEAAAYQEFATAYRAQWERMDPVIIGIRREPGGSNTRERIVLKVHVTPFAKMHYTALTQYLGPATKTAIGPIAGDAVSLQAVTGAFQFLGAGGVSTHLFFGLKDFSPPFEIRNGQVVMQNNVLQGGLGNGAVFNGLLTGGLNSLRGYIGAWPKPGLLDLLIGNRPLPLDANGYGQLPLLGLWYHRSQDLNVVSFQRDVLEQVTPQIQVIEADQPAQVRLHVADLTQAKLADLVNAYAYQRARETSVSNLMFLHFLSLEFQLPREDCLAVAQNLLDAKLVCPLGGTYKLQEKEGGLRVWTSTALANNSTKLEYNLPPGYQPPPMNWFRGLELEFAMQQNTIDAHAALDVERKEPVMPFAAPPPLPPGTKPDNGKKPGVEEIPSPTAPPATTPPSPPPPSKVPPPPAPSLPPAGPPKPSATIPPSGPPQPQSVKKN